MKFEQPIAEITKFTLKDIISSSGEGGGDDPTEESSSSPNVTTTSEMYDTMNEGHCLYNSARDNNPNWTNCA